MTAASAVHSGPGEVVEEFLLRRDTETPVDAFQVVTDRLLRKAKTIGDGWHPHVLQEQPDDFLFARPKPSQCAAAVLRLALPNARSVDGVGDPADDALEVTLPFTGVRRPSPARVLGLFVLPERQEAGGLELISVNRSAQHCAFPVLGERAGDACFEPSCNEDAGRASARAQPGSKLELLLRLAGRETYDQQARRR